MTTNLIDTAQTMEDTQYGLYLTFESGNEVFAIEIRHVTEIISMQPISTIPEAPDYVKGIINLRGKIVPVMDMRLRLKKKPVDYDDRTCIIVVEFEDTSTGLIVDQVAEVLNIADENIEPPPGKRAGIKNRYLRGIGKTADGVKLILDCEKLFAEAD